MLADPFTLMKNKLPLLMLVCLFVAANAAGADAPPVSPSESAELQKALTGLLSDALNGKGGWITRAEEFISPRYHLTEAQHRTRVAAWG
jgi:hypothetical protein